MKNTSIPKHIKQAALFILGTLALTQTFSVDAQIREITPPAEFARKIEFISSSPEVLLNVHKYRGAELFHESIVNTASTTKCDMQKNNL